jgi:regulatory protein
VGDPYSDALRLLAARELSVAECRTRLLDRDHSADDVERAIERLLDEGALNDERLARAYTRTAINIKGRGRLRIAGELRQKAIARDIISAVLAEVFGEIDERSLVSRAIQKKLRGSSRPSDTSGYARLYQHLMRQGFSPAVISAELGRLRGQRDDE